MQGMMMPYWLVIEGQPVTVGFGTGTGKTLPGDRVLRALHSASPRKPERHESLKVENLGSEFMERAREVLLPQGIILFKYSHTLVPKGQPIVGNEVYRARYDNALFGAMIVQTKLASMDETQRLLREAFSAANTSEPKLQWALGSEPEAEHFFT